MKKISIIASILGLFLYSSCTKYQPEEYGPIEFEAVFDTPRFENTENVVDVTIELDFTPEDFKINRDEIYSMTMKEIKITTDYENGFGDFDNIRFEIKADGVSSEVVGTMKVNGSPKELIIPGLNESEIKKFKNVNKYYLEITGVTKPDVEESYDDINIQGSFVMNIMVPEKNK